MLCTTEEKNIEEYQTNCSQSSGLQVPGVFSPVPEQHSPTVIYSYKSQGPSGQPGLANTRHHLQVSFALIKQTAATQTAQISLPKK